MKKFNPTDVPINFVLGYQEINLILTGLGQLPFDHVAQIYQKLQHDSLAKQRKQFFGLI